MEAKIAYCKMNYEGEMWLAKRLQKAAEWRCNVLGLKEDPFTVDVSSAMEESIMESQITKSLYKLYTGLQADLNLIEYKIKQHEQSLEARFDVNVWFKQEEEIKSLQNKTLLMLFESIEILVTPSIQETYTDPELDEAEKHTEILNTLPKRIRRALPYLLKKE